MTVRLRWSMRPHGDSPLDSAAARRLLWLRRRALASLAWESAAPLAWAPATGVVAFFVFALSGAADHLPGWPHVAVLAGFALFFLWAGLRFVRRWRPPTAAAVDRRIETDSGARHRPLTALNDAFSGADPSAAALWAAHRAQALRRIGRLRVGWPRADLAAADPRGLRHLMLLLLIVVAVGARGDWRARLATAFVPALDGTATGPLLGGDTVVEAWIAPPEALGLPPIFLSAAGLAGVQTGGTFGAPVPVPAGSRLTARAAGGRGAPTLWINGGEERFVAVDDGNFQVETTVRGGDKASVTRRGLTLAEWPIKVIPDEAPYIDFDQPPMAGERGSLRFGYVAGDDYGVVRARLRIAPAPLSPIPLSQVAGVGDGDEDVAVPVGLSAAAAEMPINLPTARARDVQGMAAMDVSGHLLAGLPAVLTLIAEDAAGQTGVSDAVTMVLPERRFVHPTAQALVAERRRLTLGGDAARSAVVAALGALARRPQDYRGDASAFLAIVAAAGRLTYDRTPQAVSDAQALMWEAALRIEDGGASQAEKALRQAQQALAEALERGAPDADLQALMEKLQAAMDAWLDALEQQMRQARANGETPPSLPPELADQLTDRSELQSMMDRMRDMAQTGARDAARQMLSQLQQMMERAQSAPSDQASTDARNRAFDLMRRLRELADKQQALQDETFQTANRGSPDGDDPAARRRAARERADARRGGGRQTASPVLQRQADRQQELRKGLGDAVREMGELSGDVPKPLGRADREMRSAENALRGGLPDAAVDPQGEAVESLRQGLQSFAEQVLRQMSGGAMAGAGQGGGQGGQSAGGSGRGRDPLGRMQPQGTGGMDTQSVKVPTEAELQRARDILDELRRRAGETARPAAERDYIDRLLRRF